VSAVNSSKMKRFVRNNALGLVLVATFLVVWLACQTSAGLRVYNQQRHDAGLAPIGWPHYLTTSHFGEATFENWESEFLQMAMYVALTVKLMQWGSAESKPLEGETDVDEDPLLHRDDPDAPWPVRRGGWMLAIYRRSLSLTFCALFLASFVLHAATGSRAYNAEQAISGGTDHTTGWSYVFRSQFWFESLQNWQSEFLAVAAIVLFSIVLRQHGSPESKPVHAPHRQTAA
jgi:hypothetical protein